MAKKDIITLIIAKAFSKQRFTKEETDVSKHLTVSELITYHCLNDLQAQEVIKWCVLSCAGLSEEEQEEVLEESIPNFLTKVKTYNDITQQKKTKAINEIFGWLKNKLKKDKSSKNINPSDILNKLKVVVDSHENHPIFYSDQTNNYLITVIGFTNWWLDYLGHFVKQYYDASTDMSRNKTPFLDKEMSPYYSDKTGVPSSASDSYKSYHYVKNVLNNYASLLEQLAKVVDHFHTASNIYERKDFRYNKNVVTKLFSAIDEFLKDQAVYDYVGEDKLFIRELTDNNFLNLKLEIKEMVKNLGVKQMSSAKRDQSQIGEHVVTSMIICTAVASFLHAKARQIRQYVKFFDTEYQTLSSLDHDINFMTDKETAKEIMSHERERAIEEFMTSKNKYKRN